MKLAIRLILAALSACAAAAQTPPAIDVTKFDMHPMVQLHAIGSDIIGHAFVVDIFVYRGGPTFLAYTAETGNARRVARAVASPQALMKLNQALADGKIGQQRGDCGQPAPDHISTRALTWYGKQRMRTVPVGGIYSECPSDVVEIFDAACSFVWEVLGPTVEYCVPVDS